MSTPIKNHFQAIIVAAARARDLKNQAKKSGVNPRHPVVQAYEEVQSGQIGLDYLNVFSLTKKNDLS
jgi:DNA-directed RNA polymerase subunit K/omega